MMRQPIRMEPLTDYLLNSPIIMVVSFLTVSALIANAVFRTKHDPKEPPLIAPSIPIVGHIWGLWYHGSRYLVRFAYVATLHQRSIRSILISRPLAERNTDIRFIRLRFLLARFTSLVSRR